MAESRGKRRSLTGLRLRRPTASNRPPARAPRSTTPAGVVFDTGPFNFTADYFRIHVSDRIGITSNFTLEDAEIDALLAQGRGRCPRPETVPVLHQRVRHPVAGHRDLVSTFTPIALRGNTVRRCGGPAGTSASPNAWRARVSFLGRVSYYGFFAGRPIVDIELTIDAAGGATGGHRRRERVRHLVSLRALTRQVGFSDDECTEPTGPD